MTQLFTAYSPDTLLDVFPTEAKRRHQLRLVGAAAAFIEQVLSISHLPKWIDHTDGAVHLTIRKILRIEYLRAGSTCGLNYEGIPE
jgi:hypothetical protein